MERTFGYMREDQAGSSNLRVFVRSSEFRVFVLALILMGGLTVGLQTALDSDGLVMVNHVLLAMFVVEAAVKLVAAGNCVVAYLSDFYNLVDTAVAVGGVVELGLTAAGVVQVHDPNSRLTPFMAARLLRLLRLFGAVKVTGLNVAARAVGAGAPMAMLAMFPLACIVYIYGALGCLLWRANDPVHFGDLWSSLVSMLSCSTIRSWTYLFEIEAYGCTRYTPNHLIRCVYPSGDKAAAVLFFVSFVVLAGSTFVGLVAGISVHILRQVRQQREECSAVLLRFNELHQVLTRLREQVDANSSTILQLKYETQDKRDWVPH
eukprot:TRINITY_DN26047_c0_g1_i2.p1 TRINITY_DN26047_c0_g1~~TRINITY_DN26047_c0_g1_i2.p1  ORF type:complete len:319 (+),score=66.47 TRINITY_DN26047_c0_g1_i2:40-996(+)